MSTQEAKLIQETERLKSALTTSQSVRGRWGELVLRNILLQSGLVAGIDFEEQVSTSGQDGNVLKPDLVIKLPQSGQSLIIDSKASIFESYLESENVSTEASRQAPSPRLRKTPAQPRAGFIRQRISKVRDLFGPLRCAFCAVRSSDSRSL